MKFNPKSLKSFFNLIRQSPIDDMAVNAVKNNADDVAMGALNAVDDIPSSISFDDIADAYKNRIPADKPPITPAEFKTQFDAEQPARRETRELLKLFPEQYTPEQYTTVSDFSDIPLPEEPSWLYDQLNSTPDYKSMRINPMHYGQNPDLIDSLEYPDGFKNPEDFARYYEDLERGYRTVPTKRVSGHSVSQPDYWSPGFDTSTLIIDNKPYHYPSPTDLVDNIYVYSHPEDTKVNILDKYRYSYDKSLPYSDGIIPTEDLVGAWTGVWRPHENTSLGKFFRKYGRLPNGLALPEPWDSQFDW